MVLWYYRVGERFSYVGIIVWGLLLRGVTLWAMPLLEDDHFRYLWDGWQSHHVGNPYRYAPAEFFGDETLPILWQEVLNHINNPDLKTIYGPVLQGLFLLAFHISAAELWPFKCLLLILDIGLMVFLARGRVNKSALLAYAIHPLLLQEALASAHPDSLPGALLVLVVWLHQRGRVLACGLLLAVACATKISALVALPLLCLSPFSRATNTRSFQFTQQEWLWAGCLLTAFLLGMLCFYWPFFISGESEWDSLLVFGSEWRFNPLLFRLLDWVLPGEWVRVCCAIVLLGCCVWLGFCYRQQQQKRLPLMLLLLLLLLLSPVVNPWYWLWLLPLAIYFQRWPVILWAAITPLSYLNSSVLSEAGMWGDSLSVQLFVVPWPITFIELLLMFWVLWREWLWFSHGQSHRQLPA